MRKLPLATKVAVVYRLNVDRIEAQLEYRTSPTSLETAKQIIRAKLRNSRMLLTNYRQAKMRVRHTSASLLLQAQNNLAMIAQFIEGADSMRMIFLLEAKAAKVYWGALRLICHQPQDWQRKHPGGEDALNRLLNVGYSLLVRRSREVLVLAGLLPQVGVLHGEHSMEPLVHDFVEVFRQVAVDAVVIPFFSRKRGVVRRLPRNDMSEAMKLLYRRYQESFWYEGRCVRLEVIMREEALRLAQAIQDDLPWKPYNHSWRHGTRC